MLFFILTSMVIPVCLYILELYVIDYDLNLPWWTWLFYIFVIHALFLFGAGIYATTLTYPYSNAFFGNQVLRNSNRRYAIEVRRCIDRMTMMIRDVVEQQSENNQGSVLGGS